MKLSRLNSFILATFILISVAAVASGLSPQASTQSSPPSTQPQDKPKLAPLEYVRVTTTKGPIVLELNRDKAPISVANFLAYANKGFYDDTVFHRVIPSFMIQGGGFTTEGKQKSTDSPIKNEWTNGLKNARGTVAMARLGGQADSATCQFFINHADNAFLDEPRDGAGYAVFGKVVAGMNVVDAIAAVPTGVRNGMANWPTEAVVIQSIKVITPDDARETIEAEKKPAAPKQP
jgi:peptidyl-prolyl cis-trans isomerase A (cyclophilin A)